MSQDKGPSPSMALPDPLHGLQNPPGRPGHLHDMSKEFFRAAEQLDDIGGDLHSLLREVRGPWEGAAEHAFLEVVSVLPRSYRNVAAGYRKAGGALKDYATALENAQQTYIASRRLADADQARQLGLLRDDPARALDLFSPDRIRARRQIEAALERLGGSTVRAHGVLKALESTLARRSPVKPEIYRGKRESMMQASREVLDKEIEDLQTLWELRRLVMPGQARDAWKQTLQENEEGFDRLRQNPLKYVADEAYAFSNMEELMAGNHARWGAGFAYNAVTRHGSKALKLITPDKKRRDDDPDRG